MARPSMVEGYPVFYLTDACEVMCGDHATEEESQHAHWEGSPLECEHEDGCSQIITSAYGEVEA